MPHFTTAPYQDGGCYGLHAADVEGMMPPSANVVLRQDEIDAVAQYVADNIKGHGEPSLSDCVAFFGEASRVCDTYRLKADGAPRHAMPTPSTTN